jgi:hypothetical protein
MPSIENWWVGEIDWYPENTRRLWEEVFCATIDVRRDIIEPAITRRKQGYGDTPPDYKSALES